MTMDAAGVSPERVNVLGVQVSVISPTAAAEAIVEWARARPRPASPRYACATSVHGLIEARHDRKFRRILNQAAMVAPDGMPMAWFGRLAGRPTMERVYGPALMLAVCQRSVPLGLRHFFYGSAEGVAIELARRLGDRFPGLAVAGTYCPPFRPLTPSERDHVTRQINASEADIVWVGLSTPKQERWVADVGPELKVGVLVTVGAAFDFHAGRVAQAPAWMQGAGLEWLFRLTREPRRLWRRYAVAVPWFLWLAGLQLAGLRKFED